MSKKTIRRDLLVLKVNNAMKAPYLSNKEKLAIATFAEALLISSDAYKGYSVDPTKEENMGLPINERKELEVSTRVYF